MSLEVRAISAGYGSDDVISGVNLEVHPGEIVALIGANGAGKSTLLKAISGLIRVSAGAIKYQGKDIHNLPTSARVQAGIVHVPEGRQVFSGMSVSQNLSLGGYVQRQGGGAQERMADVLRAFPALAGRLTHLAGNLSGGQQQMLAIGRGLMARPSLMLLDEPSLGLSPKLVDEIFKLISGLTHQGIAILLAEQNARLSLAVASRGYVMENGRISLEGAAHSLLRSEEVAEKYLGMKAKGEVAPAQDSAGLAARLRQILQ
ncbi:MAG: ABC transporter ATP-binding protein [Rhodomicrobium sp.]